MLYSPVRRSPARSKLLLLPLDLHVLSMPPAFNLSQDQTLQFIAYCHSRRDKTFNEEHPEALGFRTLPFVSCRSKHQRSAHTNCLTILLKSC